MNIFDIVLIQPILNLLLAGNLIFNLINLPFSLGFAIIFLTIFVRLILAPLTAGQIKSATKTAELRPKLAELAKKHGADKQALAKAQMELYKQHGVNPASGCLPLILQIPIFFALYNVLIRVLTNNGDLVAINQLAYFEFLKVENFPDPNFFGLNLAARPSDFAKYGGQLLAVPPITAFLQYWQSKLMMPATKPEKKEVGTRDAKPTTEETLAQIQSQMVWLMPAMIGFFSFGFPVGLSLYWNIFTLFGIVQQKLVTNKLKLNKSLSLISTFFQRKQAKGEE